MSGQTGEVYPLEGDTQSGDGFFLFFSFPFFFYIYKYMSCDLRTEPDKGYARAFESVSKHCSGGCSTSKDSTLFSIKKLVLGYNCEPVYLFGKGNVDSAL